jgi:hypothetical protein
MGFYDDLMSKWGFAETRKKSRSKRRGGGHAMSGHGTDSASASASKIGNSFSSKAKKQKAPQKK